MTETRKKSRADDVVIIKKYANRRLYNTDTSTYITLEDLCDMVKKGTDFTVQDAKTGEDITRQILTQIIFEQESKGYALLPVNFLRSVIGFYDDKVSSLLPHYLEASMQSFTENQEKMREYAKSNLGTFSPFTQLEEMGKQNLEFFKKSFSMFSPFEGYFKEQPQPKKATGTK